MLTSVEVLLYTFVCFLLPLIVYSLVTGSQPPENSWFARYYRAEKYLNFVGNLFVLSVCANAIVKLGLHFDYIDPSAKDTLEILTGTPFAVMLLAFLALWIRAALKIRRVEKSSTRPSAHT